MGSDEIHTVTVCIDTIPIPSSVKPHVEGEEDGMKHRPLYGTQAGLYYGMLPPQLDSHWHIARHLYSLGLGGELLI